MNTQVRRTVDSLNSSKMSDYYRTNYSSLFVMKKIAHNTVEGQCKTCMQKALYVANLLKKNTRELFTSRKGIWQDSENSKIS